MTDVESKEEVKISPLPTPEKTANDLETSAAPLEEVKSVLNQKRQREDSETEESTIKRQRSSPTLPERRNSLPKISEADQSSNSSHVTPLDSVQAKIEEAKRKLDAEQNAAQKALQEGLVRAKAQLLEKEDPRTEDIQKRLQQDAQAHMERARLRMQKEIKKDDEKEEESLNSASSSLPRVDPLPSPGDKRPFPENLNPLPPVPTPNFDPSRRGSLPRTPGGGYPQPGGYFQIPMPTTQPPNSGIMSPSANVPVMHPTNIHSPHQGPSMSSPPSNTSLSSQPGPSMQSMPSSGIVGPQVSPPIVQNSVPFPGMNGPGVRPGMEMSHMYHHPSNHHGHHPHHSMAPQGRPPQGIPPPGMPPQGMPPQGMPQGMQGPPQGMPSPMQHGPPGMPPQGMQMPPGMQHGPPGMAPQGLHPGMQTPPQGMPPQLSGPLPPMQSMPPGMQHGPPQGMQGHPGMPPQGMQGPPPIQGMPPGMPPQGPRPNDPRPYYDPYYSHYNRGPYPYYSNMPPPPNYYLPMPEGPYQPPSGPTTPGGHAFNMRLPENPYSKAPSPSTPNTALNSLAEAAQAAANQDSKPPTKRYASPSPNDLLNSLFSKANALKDTDRQVIVDFVTGKSTALQGTVKILLDEDYVKDPTTDDTYREFVEFEINYSTKTWKKMKKRVKVAEK